MDDLAVSTLVHLPPEEVYEVLFDFTRYQDYSEYVDRVSVRGDGPGTRFAIALTWWRLQYTLRGRVTDVDPPNRIDWSVTRDVDARGHWAIEDAGDRAPADCETASVARLYIAFDPASIGRGVLGLPPFVSVSGVVDRIRPVAKREADRVVARAVEDVEGERRPVDVRVESSPDAF